MGIREVCFRFVGDFLQAFRISSQPSSDSSMPLFLDQNHPIQQKVLKLDDKMVTALITVFGMENNGRIKKENARRVVDNLGLFYNAEEEKPPHEGGLLEEEDDEVPVEYVLDGLEDVPRHSELLREAFKIFDEDGDGYIDAMELKRVLDCLGLDKGWDMNTIEKMVKVVDLNFDGKVDFGEFELMMG